MGRIYKRGKVLRSVLLLAFYAGALDGEQFLAVWSYSARGQTFGSALGVTTDQYGQIADLGGGRIIVHGQAPVPTAHASWTT